MTQSKVNLLVFHDIIVTTHGVYYSKYLECKNSKIAKTVFLMNHGSKLYLPVSIKNHSELLSYFIFFLFCLVSYSFSLT